MLKDIDDQLQLSFPVYGGQEWEKFRTFPYVPVLDYPGCIFYVIQESVLSHVVAMTMSVVSVWPVFFVSLLLIILTGICFWILVSLYLFGSGV